MTKFTLFIASLFLALGAMAQTFVVPEVGKYYKIKGDHSSLCWLTSEIDQSSKAIKVLQMRMMLLFLKELRMVFVFFLPVSIWA